MPPISRLLVPVDFSDQCTGMLAYVRSIAERYAAETILLHVVRPVYVVPPTGISGPTAVRTPTWVVPKRKKQLDALAKNQLHGLPAQCLVYEGEPEERICAFTQREDVDLIVMPTHGYGILRRFLIGSVTAKVLHDVSCPVLTGAHLQPQGPPPVASFSNIACAIDLSPYSVSTVKWASQFAKDFEGKLSLVHVIPPASSMMPAKLKQEVEQRAFRSVEELQMDAGASAAAICIREGDVAREVCTFAESIGADLLVAGRSSQSSGLGRLRTNAYAIIRESRCAVLSV